MTIVPFDPPRVDRAADLTSQLVWLKSVAPVLRSNYMVKGWLGQGTMSVVFGPSNVGKTFVVLDIAMHVAANRPWRGCPVKGGPVLYIAAEGGSGILNRLAAFKQEHSDMADAPFMVLPTSLDLYGDGDAVALCEVIEDIRVEFGEKPALIVVDTLARSMGDGDENATKDMGAFVRNCDVLRAATGAHVLVVHHTGKDESRGARGAYALKAACDTEIQLTAKREILCNKQRDLQMGSALHFDLRTVALGTDEDGDTVTSCVVDSSDAPPRGPKHLNGKKQVAMSALHDAVRDHGQAVAGPNYPVDCKAVHIDYWREACATHGLTTGSSESAARTAFKRAKDGLLEMDVVRIYGDYVWRVDDD